MPGNDGTAARSVAGAAHEVHVHALTFWHLLSAAMCFVAGPILLLLGSVVDTTMAAIGGVLVLLGLVRYLLAAGLRDRRWWARLIYAFFAVIGVLSALVGMIPFAGPSQEWAGAIVGSTLSLAWEGAILWLLFSHEGNAYFAQARRRGEPRPKLGGQIVSSPFFYVPMLAFLFAMLAIAVMMMAVVGGF